MAKFRSALRLIWSRSAERKAYINAVAVPHANYGKAFVCPICGDTWPLPMADVDHEPPIGEFASIDEISPWLRKMYYGPQKPICKICHKKKTAEQKRKGAL